MICPYNVKVHITVQQWTQEYSEENENQLPTGTTWTNEYFKQMDCVREECGAFYNGRGNYKSE